ncbi:putative ABC-type molybdenum transporter, ATP-binding protein [Arcticibacter svalbardensis MN12-7]|uniref:Putative ABC-type molybdenum transporter, ATP-binding protein n=1 Tax=Arcticibacter svalbardensis MN12-7 TaxID=1150600 RepID=R9GVD9_9SPHI|nr:ATP-binding cassette domain-containing protein [Arcticibacter svalbardensis]EOR95812.1 putative ABC-type molybdenum transporter, ATP-binding protein [Arcticibacter svalbardensis MN12-7]
MAKTILAFEHITVRNLNQIIFEDLSFSISECENWALIGESGSGKSALLETIAGRLGLSKGFIDTSYFESANQGVASEGELINWHKRISFVSSKHNFRNLSNTTEFYYQQRYNSMDSDNAPTVGSYLSGLKPHLPSAYWNIKRVVQRLNLSDLMDEQIIKLSNGETKRLLLAAALIKNPILLLLDNPLTGLDIKSRADFNDLITEVNASGIHIIMATSPSEIPDAVTHIAVFEHCRIIKSLMHKAFLEGLYVDSSTAPLDLVELKELINRTTIPPFDYIVKMENIVVRYGKALILNDVNWTIRQGECWALLGANGSGKSTLLSLINGDNPQAYANDITIFDRKRGTGESIWDIKKKIGFVSPELFQYFPSSSSCMHVVESGFYDTLGLYRASDPKLAGTAMRWMKVMGIEDIAGKLFRNISASNQRLCLLARALVKNPVLLIFDEPCQGLDSKQKDHFKQLVNAICYNSNVTLIYVSHYAEEIPDVVDQVLRLEKVVVETDA